MDLAKTTIAMSAPPAEPAAATAPADSGIFARFLKK